MIDPIKVAEMLVDYVNIHYSEYPGSYRYNEDLKEGEYVVETSIGAHLKENKHKAFGQFIRVSKETISDDGAWDWFYYIQDIFGNEVKWNNCRLVKVKDIKEMM